MNVLSELYRPSLALLTDLYQLTMSYAVYRAGMAEHEAVFHLFFRKNPFHGGFAVACGLEPALEYVERFGFDQEDLAYLGGLQGADGERLFDEEFLEHLRGLRLACDVDAVPEGTVVFPHEPLVRVRGPIIACMLLETPLLNLINFQTLIATKAARVCQSTRGESVLEFGLRRAQGVDGALAASRAAYVGGCAATSNVLAGRLYGIPVRGTHAHSWVMLFDEEREAFAAYARALPGNCVFLVDTYSTLEGVRRAIEVGCWLKERGKKLLGVRLDSGDLAYLSIQARKLLDEAGFSDAVVVASNDLDEHIIASLKEQQAAIAVWGVGTKLCTAYDEPALGGVYKLAAVRRPGGPWQHRLKLSEQVAKISTPGLLQVRRFVENGESVADMIYDEERGVAGEATIVDPLDMTRRRTLGAGTAWTNLLIPVMRGGRCLAPAPDLAAARERRAQQLSSFHAGIKRLVNPHQYPVGLERSLHEFKTELILRARGQAEGSPR